MQACRAVQDLVVDDVDVTGLLETDPDTGGAGGVRDMVPAHDDTVAVHQEDTDRVAAKVVFLDQVVL